MEACLWPQVLWVLKTTIIIQKTKDIEEIEKIEYIYIYIRNCQEKKKKNDL